MTRAADMIPLEQYESEVFSVSSRVAIYIGERKRVKGLYGNRWCGCTGRPYSCVSFSAETTNISRNCCCKHTSIMDPKGKGVFLTGGAQGLGRGIMESLLSLGAKVLFCDVNVERGRATEAELQTQYGADVVFFEPADVSDDEQHKAAFGMAVSKLGTVDICVNNAGILNENNWEKVMAINAGSHIRGSLLALEHMRRDRGGRGGVIINVASTLGLTPSPACPTYTASKHAVVGFTTSWAMSPDQKDHGIRWCCLCPDTIQTSLIEATDNIYHPEILEQHLKQHGVMSVSQVADEVVKLIRDPDNNGAILEVSLKEGARYRRRQVVDRDGVSDLVVVDTY